MAFALPNGSTFDVAGTYAAVKTMTTVTNAANAVVTSTAHGLVTGDYIHITTSGWSILNNRTFKITQTTADTFTIQGADTTNTVKYPAGAGVGSFRKIQTWVSIPQILTVETSGGEQGFNNVQFLESDDEIQIPTVKSAQTVTLNVADDPAQQYVPLIEGYDAAKTVNVLRLNVINGDTVVYTGIINITATPTLSINELMQRTITCALVSRSTRYKGA